MGNMIRQYACLDEKISCFCSRQQILFSYIFNIADVLGMYVILPPIADFQLIQ